MLHHPALPALLGFLALLIIALPAWGLLYRFRSRERGVGGVATIIEKEERPFRGDFHTWVEFAGYRCRVIVTKEKWKEIRPGASLEIRYDPEKPGQITHEMTPAWPRGTLVFSVLIAFGLLIAAAAWRLWFD